MIRNEDRDHGAAPCQAGAARLQASAADEQCRAQQRRGPAQTLRLRSVQPAWRLAMSYVRSPLVASALAALEREAQHNADAARLLATIEEVHGFCRYWCWLEVLN